MTSGDRASIIAIRLSKKDLQATRRAPPSVKTPVLVLLATRAGAVAYAARIMKIREANASVYLRLGGHTN